MTAARQLALQHGPTYLLIQNIALVLPQASTLEASEEREELAAQLEDRDSQLQHLQLQLTQASHC